MRAPVLWLFLVAGLVKAVSHSIAHAGEPAGESDGFRFDAVSETSLGLWQGGKPVLVYNHGLMAQAELPGARARACYFHPVYGLDGEVLTDDFPKDHVYHRGMYWAWPHIKIGDHEYDLWSVKPELGQRFQRWLVRDASAGGAKLGAENGWFAGNEQLVTERVWVDVQPAAASGRAIDIKLTWTSLEQPLTLSGAEGKSYGGFNFRFGPRAKTVITVPENMPLSDGALAPAGKTSGDLLVTRLPWADFVGDFAGDAKLSGAAVFIHPQHPDYPPTWMTRHYGLVSVGWPGVEAKTFAAGEEITLQYRILIHRGEFSAAQIQKEYDNYSRNAPASRR